MNLTKDHIMNSVQDHLELPKSRSSELVESLLEIIKKALENGEDVLISGFGKFCVKEKAERRGSGRRIRSFLNGYLRELDVDVLRDKLNTEGLKGGP